MQEILPPGTAVYVLEVMRNHQRDTIDCESLEDAVSMAFWGLEDGNFYPERIKNVAGDIVVDDKELEKRINNYSPPPQS
jgi:hypothetical protein